MHPGFFNHLLLISLFELKRFFATRKGLLSLLTFLVVWGFILKYPLRAVANLMVEGKEILKHFRFFDFIGLSSFQNWPIPEFAVFWHFALILFPILSISLAADQTGSDRERGTLRFLALRTSRDCLFFGRFIGMMAIQTLLIVIAAASTLVLTVHRDAALLPYAVSNLSAITVNLILTVLPFTAMMAVLSAKVRTVRQATVWAIFIWMFFAFFIRLLSYYLPALAFLKYLVPGYQLTELAQLTGWDTLQLAYIPLLQSLFLLTVGRWIMARQSL